MKPKLLVFSMLLACALIVPGATPRTADAQPAVALRIATLAPTGSSWMKVFNAWNRTLQEKSNGTLSLRFYPGGSQGDERDFIRKMRAGQMDGAAVTSTGLGMIVRPVLVLSAPGLFTTYEEVDKVRNALKDDFEQEFLNAGYKLLGWGDVGKLRLFSNEKILKPSDLKHARPWAWRDDLIFTNFLKVVGANGISMGVPEVYPALQTGMVDTVPASAIAAVSLQWYTRLKYVSEQNMGILIGATILRKESFDALTPEQKSVLMSTSERAHAVLAKLIRRDDDTSYDTILKRNITAVDTNPYRAEWQAELDKTRKILVGRVYPAPLLAKVEHILNEK
ncbi:MAG: TRAP transporter substrate-binding protein DctP [Myxococcales bacterium]|nr:TRAP transporter substrate-binding protein DctP [Myxococcales bacterium]